MSAVYIGIGHDDQFLVAGLADIKVSSKTSSHSSKETADFFIGQYLVHAGFLNVENLTTNWQNSLKFTVTAGLS